MTGFATLHDVARAESAQAADIDTITTAVLSLLAAGADPHAADEAGETAFNAAAPAAPVTGRLLTIFWLGQALAGRGSRGLNDVSGSHGSTLAQYIAKWSRDGEIEAHLAMGAARGMRADVPNASGWTPLIAAAAMGRAAAVRALLPLYTPGTQDLRTTLSYTAQYGGATVAYAAGLTAADVAAARLAQDKSLLPAQQADLQSCIALLWNHPAPEA